MAGASAGKKAADLRRRNDASIDGKWGRLSGVVRFIGEDPQSLRAWEKGAAGERRLAGVLAAVVGDRAVLLHDRAVSGTRGNIDHLAISSSGVWVIDAKNYTGRVERRRRSKGMFSTPDYRIYVGGRDHTKLAGADGMGWQLAAVAEVLEGLDIPVKGVLCFTEAGRGMFPSSSFEYKGVLVTWPGDLASRIGRQGDLTPEGVLYIGELLFEAFPAVRVV